MKMMRQLKKWNAVQMLSFFAFTVLFVFTLCYITGPVSHAAGVGSGNFQPGDTSVFDEAGLFSESDIETLEQQIAVMREDMDMDVVIVTTDDAEGKSSEDYTEDFYIDGNFGVGDDYSGVIFLIDMDNRSLFLSPVGKMNRYLTDERWNDILDQAYEGVSDGDYMASADAFLNGVSSYYEKGIPSGQYNYDEETGEISVYRSIRWYEVLLAIAVAAFAAITPCLSIANRYAMKKERRQADNYLMAYRADCHFQFANTTDNLINKTVTHVIIPKNNDNSGNNSGGGGFSPGQSTTHTTSGRDFGGGGRKF